MKKILRFRSNDLATNDDELVVSGYFAVFNEETMLTATEKEVIKKGAFSKSLAKNDIVALWNHDSQKVLGRTSNKTLVLEEDEKGLKGTLKIANTSFGRDVYELIKRSDISGCSFGFYVNNYTLNSEREAGTETYELTDVELLEVSVVTWPQYEQTSITARSKSDLTDFYANENNKKKKELIKKVYEKAFGVN